MLFRQIFNLLTKEPKVILLYGPRQVGKTTLMRRILAETSLSYLLLNGDDLRAHEVLQPNLDKLLALVGNKQLLVIDEAQRIENIGLTLKLLYDHVGLPIFITGSSSLDLANKINEPLTGRTAIFTMYPLAWEELPAPSPLLSNLQRLEDLLRYGSYPSLFALSNEDKEHYLYDLVNTYLYRDILTFERVRKPQKVVDLLTLLALQIGSEVSTAELAGRLALSKPIVEKYLDLLVKMFVVVNLRGFSRNLRNEISKTSKYYFTDIGLRNALIRNFNPLHLRQDIGAMFENFCIIERMKLYHNRRAYANFYFWRTYAQREIDLVEETQGQLHAFEFKWRQAKGNAKAAAEFCEAYPGSTFHTISPENLDNFLSR
ncbi:MAG: ATP-binding protein [Anaerolineales bacterium]